MKVKEFRPGDEVILQTKYSEWRGHILESSNPEVILLKLNTGYNIGLKESEILDANLLKKVTITKKDSQIKNKGDGSLPNIAMIITGGTISSKLDPKTGGVIPTSNVGDVLNIAPELTTICNIISIKSPFIKLSEEMDPSDWKKIANTAAELLNDEKIDGLIITHGTDTLSYTASALSFFLQNINKPIALTYAQKSIDRGSTDAHLNLLCAARYAVSEIAEIALIGHENENDETCIAIPATKTRKMHTSKRDAFKAINTNSFARITKDSLEVLKEFNAKDSSKKVTLDTSYSEKVAMISVYPGASPNILDYYQKEGYKGLILNLTGLGNINGKNSSNNWLPKIKKAIDSGMVIAAAPQTIFGRLNPNVYAAGRNLQKTGIIHLEDILAETALIKLGWILGHKSWAKDKEKMKEMLLKNISHEYNKRLKE